MLFIGMFHYNLCSLHYQFQSLLQSTHIRGEPQQALKVSIPKYSKRSSLSP